MVSTSVTPVPRTDTSPLLNGMVHADGEPIPIREVMTASSAIALSHDNADATRVIKNVTSGAAHDITNLLCVIGFDLDSLEGEWLSQQGGQALRSLRVEMSYLRSLARELMMSASDTETPEVTLHTRMAAWWQDMRKLLHAAYRDGIVVSANIPWGLPAAAIAPRHLTQVVLNLVGNAAHAIAERHDSQTGAAARIPARGRIRVAARSCADGRTLELTIADDGPGMSAETLLLACEPNFTSRASVGGSGLGLALVRRLIADAGGVFRLASSQNTGTTVTIELPIHSK
jgi:signal transduction histidine kinase